MHGDGRQHGEEMVKHEVKKKDIAAVRARYCNTDGTYAPGLYRRSTIPQFGVSFVLLH
jgi:hypothetical protein